MWKRRRCDLPLALLALGVLSSCKRRGPDTDWAACARQGTQDCAELASQRCGSVESQGPFSGKWKYDPAPELDQARRSMYEQMFEDFVVGPNRIQSGRGLRQDLCFLDVAQHDAASLDAAVLWHEDIHDPGDAHVILVNLKTIPGGMEFRIYTESSELSRPAARFRR